MLHTSVTEAEHSCELAAFSSAIAERFCTVSVTAVLVLSSFSVKPVISLTPSIDTSILSLTLSNAEFVFLTFMLCLFMISRTSCIPLTACCESSISFSVISSICLADSLDCSASFCICEATTANPRPCSPALAASILALSERRLVSSAIDVIILIAALISSTDLLVVLVLS